MDKSAKISIAGHRGLVGSAILRNLQAKGHANLPLLTSELEPTNEPYAAAVWPAAFPSSQLPALDNPEKQPLRGRPSRTNHACRWKTPMSSSLAESDRRGVPSPGPEAEELLSWSTRRASR